MLNLVKDAKVLANGVLSLNGAKPVRAGGAVPAGKRAWAKTCDPLHKKNFRRSLDKDNKTCYN